MAAHRPAALNEARWRTPLTLAVFDVLWLDGDVTGEPYRDRRQLLEQLELSGPGWCTVSSFPGDGAEPFAACSALGLGGLVAQELRFRCEPGVRSKFWVKAKCADWLTGHAEHRHG